MMKPAPPAAVITMPAPWDRTDFIDATPESLESAWSSLTSAQIRDHFQNHVQYHWIRLSGVIKDINYNASRYYVQLFGTSQRMNISMAFGWEYAARLQLMRAGMTIEAEGQIVSTAPSSNWPLYTLALDKCRLLTP